MLEHSKKVFQVITFSLKIGNQALLEGVNSCLLQMESLCSWSLFVPKGWEKLDCIQHQLVSHKEQLDLPLRSPPASTILVRKLFIQGKKKKR